MGDLDLPVCGKVVPLSPEGPGAPPGPSCRPLPGRASRAPPLSESRGPPGPQPSPRKTDCHSYSFQTAWSTRLSEVVRRLVPAGEGRQLPLVFLLICCSVEQGKITRERPRGAIASEKSSTSAQPTGSEALLGTHAAALGFEGDRTRPRSSRLFAGTVILGGQSSSVSPPPPTLGHRCPPLSSEPCLPWAGLACKGQSTPSP